MFRLTFAFLIFLCITLINADDGGLSDIPFNGTPDDVADAFRTKLAVELAEKEKTSTLNKKILSAIAGGHDIVAPVAPTGILGAGIGARIRDPRPIDINAAGGRPIDINLAGGRTFGNEITSLRNLPMIFQGCSHDIRNIFDAPCENIGISDVYQKRGHQISSHGILSCCNNNFCNSALITSLFYTTIFAISIIIFVIAK